MGPSKPCFYSLLLVEPRSRTWAGATPFFNRVVAGLLEQKQNSLVVKTAINRSSSLLSAVTNHLWLVSLDRPWILVKMCQNSKDIGLWRCLRVGLRRPSKRGWSYIAIAHFFSQSFNIMTFVIQPLDDGALSFYRQLNCIRNGKHNTISSTHPPRVLEMGWIKRYSVRYHGTRRLARKAADLTVQLSIDVVV